ncbi:hypothetical protein T11_4582 [Trichinella zimbabwensis]|uniref:Uncharacterized protein n=1 Tax=Trichinella zimbabwensis TaxID=268475 RepID=A0A0V1GAF5_9BILA|nr:hypothetical protein T11_4582 [Trichinella zimbabwensis]
MKECSSSVAISETANNISVQIFFSDFKLRKLNFYGYLKKLR